MLRRFHVEEDGQDLVEYSLLIALLAVSVIALIGSVGGNIESYLTGMSNALVSASSAAGS